MLDIADTSRSSSLSILGVFFAAAFVVACGASSGPPEQAPGGSTWTLTPKQRTAMLERLKSETGPTKDVWFATAKNDPAAATFQKTLQEVFEEAGWRVRGNAAISFSMTPGIFFLTADQEPPTYVDTAYGALADAAGISLGGGRRYREFYAKKKQEDPKWDGIELAPDQTYVIAVGPKGAS